MYQGRTLKNQKGSIGECNFVLWGLGNRKPGRGKAPSCPPHPSLYLCLLPMLFWAENWVSLPLRSVPFMTSCTLKCFLQVTWKNWSLACQQLCAVCFAVSALALRGLLSSNLRKLEAVSVCPFQLDACSLLVNLGFKWAPEWQESLHEQLQLACGAGCH